MVYKLFRWKGTRWLYNILSLFLHSTSYGCILIYLSINYSFIYLLVHLFIYSFINLFNYSFIYTYCSASSLSLDSYLKFIRCSYLYCFYRIDACPSPQISTCSNIRRIVIRSTEPPILENHSNLPINSQASNWIFCQFLLLFFII